ncbi:hypothetical protein D3C86_1579240 [compost metagenome]
MRQHWLATDVADSEDVWNTGSALSVDFNKATFVNRDTSTFKICLVTIWTTADSDKNFIAFNDFVFTIYFISDFVTVFDFFLTFSFSTVDDFNA